MREQHAADLRRRAGDEEAHAGPLALRATPSITLAAVESRNGTAGAVEDEGPALVGDAVEHAPTVEAAPKKKAPEMR